MSARLLVLNAGSSSIKATAFDSGLEVLGRWQADLLAASPAWHGADENEPLPDASSESAVAALGRILARRNLSPLAIGHRVVHGGLRFVAPVEVGSGVLEELETTSVLAPLHNPPALAILRAARLLFPKGRHIALFDTAFHATIPPLNHRYAVPADWEKNFGMRRYGFHGFSHAWSAARARELLGAQGARRLVVLHLGQGCSGTAILEGRSFATKMGFTPMDGLPMGTRSGSIDPGALLHLLAQPGADAGSLARVLWKQSGWMALSGVSADFRKVVEAAEGGNADAAFAIDHLAARCREAVGWLAAAMGGIDALAFTGGIGEHCGPLRAKVTGGLGFLRIPEGSVLVVPAEEERQMAKEMAGLEEPG
ncbi:MAG: acetate/propionate family kinase [Planctomycetota bacterium]